MQTQTEKMVGAQGGSTQRVQIFIVGSLDAQKTRMKELADHPEVRVLGGASFGETTMNLVERLSPDLVVVELGADGLAAAEQLHTRFPKLEILVLAHVPDESQGLQAIRAGAAGYLPSATPLSALVHSIKEIVRGGTVLTPQLARQVLRRLTEETGSTNVDLPVERSVTGRAHSRALSGREKEILQLVARGVTNPEAAAVLNISRATIRTHLERIYRKLDVTNRVEAITLAIRMGLIAA